MQTIKLGKNGPEISVIGFGAWGISGRDWGKTDDSTSKKAIHSALDKGISFIDTADVYGFGHSERLIAEVLKERNSTQKPVIATKAGNNFYPFLEKSFDSTPANPDYSKKHLIFAAEQSLKRLNTESLDILQLHSPTTDLLEKDEPWEALEILKKTGKIKHVGWSVQSFKETEQAHILDRHSDLIDVIQVRYNLLEREAEKVLFPKALKYGTGVIVRIPLLFGLLSGKFSKNTLFSSTDHRQLNLSPEKLQNYLETLSKYDSFFENHKHYSKAQLSLKFCISHPACHVVIPGIKTEKQAFENVVAGTISDIYFTDFFV